MIDVSKYQNYVDFEKMKAAGYSFVLIRVGYGKLLTQKDPMTVFQICVCVGTSFKAWIVF